MQGPDDPPFTRVFVDYFSPFLVKIVKEESGDGMVNAMLPVTSSSMTGLVVGQ